MSEFISMNFEAKNSEKNKFKVDYRFKIIYTIGIISVIASHLKGKGSIELNIQGWFPYRSFHMPLFMFSSGYFFKTKNVFHAYEYIFRKN
jgi:fucose 4-O-acetylase-like acetyltransferase